MHLVISEKNIHTRRDATKQIFQMRQIFFYESLDIFGET